MTLKEAFILIVVVAALAMNYTYSEGVKHGKEQATAEVKR